MPEPYDVHTCSAECPCQTGGEPTPDFLPTAESAGAMLMLALGIPAREVAEAVMDARRRTSHPTPEEGR